MANAIELLKKIVAGENIVPKYDEEKYNKAVDKINKEISEKVQNISIKVIGEYILSHIKNNPEDSEKVLDDNKTIQKSLSVMEQEGKKCMIKTGNVGCAVLSDEQGFYIVSKYFGFIKENNSSTPELGEDKE